MHGVAINIFLPYGLEYNLPKVATEIGDLLLPLGGADLYACTSPDKGPEMTIATLRRLQSDLKDAVGLPTTLSGAGVTRDQLPAIAKSALGVLENAF